MIFLTLGTNTYAQGLSLSISPPILEIIIKPGKSVTQVFKIVNNGETVTVKPRLAEMTEAGLKEDPNFAAEKWIQLVNTDLRLNQPFLLRQGETRQLILRLNPPVGTPEQEIYRLLLLETLPNPAGETSMSSLSQIIGAPLLVSITQTGLLAKGALVTKFELPSLIDSFGPLEAAVQVKNTGKTYFRPVGTISLAGPIGKGSYPLATNVFLAGQTRTLLAEGLSGTGRSLSLSGFFLGRYKLTVDFTLDQSKFRLAQTKTFYALPWKVGLTILGIGILIVLLKKKSIIIKRRK